MGNPIEKYVYISMNFSKLLKEYYKRIKSHHLTNCNSQYQAKAYLLFASPS
jgi:hypothetical protein